MSAPAHAVPAPEPSRAQAPEPRTVWTTPDGQTALVARDWADGAPPTYGVLQRARVRHQAKDGPQPQWRAATAEETWHLVDQWYHHHREQAWPLVAALARLLDQGPLPNANGCRAASARPPC